MGKFDVMLDVVSLHTDIPRSDHRVFHIGNIAEKAHLTNAASYTLPPPAMDTDNEQSLEVSDTSGISTKFS